MLELNISLKKVPRLKAGLMESFRPNNCLKLKLRIY